MAAEDEEYTVYPPWADLPEPTLTHVMLFLPMSERCAMAIVCKNWNHCFDSPILWKILNCGFFFPNHCKWLPFVEKYGHFVTHLTLSLNQDSEQNRENALTAIKCFTDLSNIRLTHFKVSFKGRNPLFYAGREFVIALCTLFDKIGSDNSKLRSLNLNELPIDFDDTFIQHVSSNCPNLEYLNILNKVLICNISPPSLKDLVDRCQNLQILHIYHASMSDNVLEALSQPERTPLKRLGLVCRREEKYGQDLSSDAWSRLASSNPDLEVELGFDHTCPLYRVSEIMKPEIPVLELHLVTFTRIYPEINTASSYYNNTLEKLVVQTRPSEELNEALLNLVQRCHKLQSLIVYCVVGKAVKEQILDLCPEMKTKGSYILKTEMEPEPWCTVGEEEGDD